MFELALIKTGRPKFDLIVLERSSGLDIHCSLSKNDEMLPALIMSKCSVFVTESITFPLKFWFHN